MRALERTTGGAQLPEDPDTRRDGGHAGIRTAAAVGIAHTQRTHCNGRGAAALIRDGSAPACCPPARGCRQP